MLLVREEGQVDGAGYRRETGGCYWLEEMGRWMLLVRGEGQVDVAG